MKVYHLDWDKCKRLSSTILTALTNPVFTDFGDLNEDGKIYNYVKTAYQNHCYTLVAEVDSDEPDYAYIYTQNLVRPWSEEPQKGVEPIAITPYRSSYLGDILEMNGEYTIISSTGFRKLNNFHKVSKLLIPS